MTTDKTDLREILIDAHAHFFFLKGDSAFRLRLWQITADSIIVDMPKNAPLKRTVLGYVPTLDGESVYELEGRVMIDPTPDQLPNTIRIAIEAGHIKKINRRKYSRVTFDEPIYIRIQEKNQKGAAVINGKLFDFSAGGLRVETTEPLLRDILYRFQFSLETDDEIHDLNLAGLVVHELPEIHGYTYGIEFSMKPLDEKSAEAETEELDQTVDLLTLVNRLLIQLK